MCGRNQRNSKVCAFYLFHNDLSRMSFMLSEMMTATGPLFFYVRADAVMRFI